MSRKKWIAPIFTTVALLSAAAGTAIAGPIVSADWSTPASGTIAGATFTMNGLDGQFLGLEMRSYTSTDYSAAPLPNVTAVSYGARDDWTASFNRPLPDLFLYVDLWRGVYTTFQPDPPTHYTFSLPFTILSGLRGASISGNTLTLPDTVDGVKSFYNGIIKFSGPIASLSVNSDGLNESGQLLTFATTAPEPSSLALASIVGVAGLAYWWRRRWRTGSARLRRYAAGGTSRKSAKATRYASDFSNGLINIH